MEELIGCPAHFEAQVEHDPRPVYQDLLDQHPVHIGADGLVTVTRYDHILEVVRRHDVFSNLQPVEQNPMGGIEALVLADEPLHGIHRRLVNKAFTPRRVDELALVIRSHVRTLIDGFVDRGECDFIEEFAYPLPVIVIAELFGVPTADRAMFKRWADALFIAIGDPQNAMEQGIEQLLEFAAYLLTKRTERQAMIDGGTSPPNDLLTALILAEDDGRRLAEDEFFVIAAQILAAGHETSTNLLGNALKLLCEHPEQLDRLKANPDLLDNTVEEVLRFESPAQWLWRTATTDYVLDGVTIPAGSRVRIVFAAANRDPRRWSAPEEFRIDRELESLRGHLAFGFGIHTCLGASLARLEAQVALESVLERLPGLHLDPEHGAEPVEPKFFRGWRTLPIRWTPPAESAERPMAAISSA